jgi:alkylation response protein AidB-like acyl-CoA dehydrogenase
VTDASRADLLAACTAFVDARVAPFAGDWDRTEELPNEIVQAVAEARYLGLAFRGPLSEIDMLSVALVHEEIGRGCSALRSLLTVQGMVGRALVRWGDAELAATWVERLAQGHAIAALAVTESEAGSDAAAVKTSLDFDGDTMVLSGRKRWISFGQLANCILVLARSEAGLCTVLVDSRVPGLTATPVRGMLGVRATHLADLVFDGCRLPRRAMIGRPGMGLSVVISEALHFGRFSIACGCVGLTRACLEASLARAASRSQFGTTLRHHQLVRRSLTKMLVGVETARLLCQHAAKLCNDGDPASIQATALAKYQSAEVAMSAATAAVQLFGAEGLSPSQPVERYLRDAKVMQIIEGTTELHEISLADYAFRKYVRI